jgi:hypothetical protein
MIDLDIDMSPLPLVLFSPVFFLVVGLLSVVLLLVLFLLYKSNIAVAIASVGTPIALSGLSLFGVGTLVAASLQSADGEPVRFSQFLEDPVHMLSYLGLITAGIGVTIVIVSIIVRLARPSP